MSRWSVQWESGADGDRPTWLQVARLCVVLLVAVIVVTAVVALVAGWLLRATDIGQTVRPFARYLPPVWT